MKLFLKIKNSPKICLSHIDLPHYYLMQISYTRPSILVSVSSKVSWLYTNRGDHNFFVNTRQVFGTEIYF